MTHDYSHPPVPGSLRIPGSNYGVRPAWPVPTGYRAPIRFYTGRGYRELNRKLRTGEPLSDKEQQVHEKLWRLMAATHSFDEPWTTSRIVRIPKQYREPTKVKYEYLFDDIPDSANPRIGRLLHKSVGRTITLPGYTSTSYKSDYEDHYNGWPSDTFDFPGQLLMKIHVKHGLHVKSHSYHPRENEILLPHNSKFRVLGYSQPQHAHRVELEQVV